MPQIWTRWLQVKRIRSGTPDHNPIPATARKTPLLEHQPNLFNSTLIRRYCRQLDFYTGEDNHTSCECPVMDSSPGKNAKFTYRLQACSESVKRAGYYRELTVRPLTRATWRRPGWSAYRSPNCWTAGSRRRGPLGQGSRSYTGGRTSEPD